jgi:hypothetical protein
VVVADFPGDTHPHTHTVVEEEETSFRGTQTEHKLSSKEAEQTQFKRGREQHSKKNLNGKGLCLILRI